MAIKRVVVAIDGSEVSYGIIDYALHYAEMEKDVELLFIHVREPLGHRRVSFAGLADFSPNESDLREEFEKFIKDQIKMSGLPKPLMTIWVAEGIPYDEILSFAEKKNADLIMIGHRGLGNLERFFLGSVAAKVVAHAPCSVYVYRPKEDRP